jgi:hypothetical protein
MNVHYLTDTQGHADSVVVPLDLWQRILDSLEKPPESALILDEIPDPPSPLEQDSPAKPGNPLKSLLDSGFVDCFETAPGLSSDYKAEFGKIIDEKYGHR